jgi:hypothetical protein
MHKPYRSPGFGASCQQGVLRLRGRFRQEIVDAGALGDGSGSQAVIASDHDGAQPHLTQRGDTDVDVRLERILQHDHPKRRVAVCHQERRQAPPPLLPVPAPSSDRVQRIYARFMARVWVSSRKLIR